MAEEGLDAVFISGNSNVRYLSDFSGSDAALYISANRNCLITDHRYTEQAAMECAEFCVEPHTAAAGRGMYELVARFCDDDGVKRLGFEKEHLLYGDYLQLSKSLPQAVEAVPFAGLTENIRMSKSPEEIELLRYACAATDRVFARICDYLHPGISEKDVERELLYYIMGEGCDSSFSVIVASGRNGSLPHAIPGGKLLTKGEFVTMDFGCAYKGYHADMTRTVFLGQPDQRSNEVYEMVLEAKNRSQNLIKPGMICRDVDAAARNYFAEMGCADKFKHGLGHGVGLDIHEAPRLNTTCETVLAPGHTVTVEPGLYFPGWGGVRIEDTVLVTESGSENLFISPTELICID